MSVHLERSPDALPEDNGEEAAEGTAAAWVAETIINGDASCTEDLVGRVHTNGVEIDLDMARHLQPYVDMVATRRFPKAEVFRKVHIHDTAELAGTLDLESWSSSGDYHIDDLKYGFGIVEPTSDQLMAYAALAYAGGERCARWHLGIYQPRAQHPEGVYRTVTYTLAEIEIKIAELWKRAQIAVSTDQTATPGDQCRHCRGAHHCVALTHSVYSMWKPIEHRSVITPTVEQLADEMVMLDKMEKMVSARRAAVRAEATALIQGGAFIPGWAIIPQEGNRKFKFPAEVIQALTGVDPTVSKLCTPAELIRRKVPESIVNSLSTKPIVGYKLEPYNPSKIGRLFEAK